MKPKIFLLFLFLLALPSLKAQNIIQEDTQKRETFSSDSIQLEGVPEGIYAWNIDSRFGTILPANYDTIPHLFPNEAFTEGLTGHYNTTGNLGAPRISHIFTDNERTSFTGGQFVFQHPYDFFLFRPDQLLFTNTKSPFTNLTYHECGNKQNGEDRLKALFSVNINKQVGLGFRIEYLYGRGYYANQNNSQFGATFFGSYLRDKYNLHAYYTTNHLKTHENGGIENDDYVLRPEIYATSFGTSDIPTNLQHTFNKMNVRTFFLTHRYNIGFTRYKDAEGRVVRLSQDKAAKKITKPVPTDSLLSFSDSLRRNPDSIQLAQIQPPAPSPTDTMTLTPEFVPVTSFIHTLQIDHHDRRFYSNDASSTAEAYFNDFFYSANSIDDLTRYFRVANTLAFEVNEGFNKWLRTGMRLYAKHEFYRYSLPAFNSEASLIRKAYTDNYITVGAELLKHQGRIFHYDVLGELRSNGKDWGEFNVEAKADCNIPLFRDTLRVELNGFFRNEQPNFYMQHYHAMNAWWDNDLENQLSMQVGGTLAYRDTRLTLVFQNVQHLAYFKETLNPFTTADDLTGYTHAVGVAQKNGSVQLLRATLRQDFHFGIFNWENELTYQASSDNDVLPLPAFSAWSNIYLKFRIAKVLNTEIGVDARYFTKYYAPTYVPMVGQYATQDDATRIKVGNYPILNAYINFHLKRTRFYVMASHINSSSGSGCPFLVPHYPINRFVLRLGVSWNFIN